MPEYDSYDLIVAGGGTAGCLIASRIAQHGINPRTGDRLRIALIEGGPYFIRGESELRPGYGVPERRKAVVNINYQEFRAEPWPYDGMQNKMVGGCGLHWGGNGLLPFREDYDHWRRETGVNWDEKILQAAVEEISKVYNLHPSISENMTVGNNLYRDAALAMGQDPKPSPMGRRNCINCGYCGSGHLCKYDSKGSSLYYIHECEKHGVKIIPDAEIEKVIIEKQGGRAIARGVHYTQHGQPREARAPKILVTCGTGGTPVVLMRSGYGPREILGDRLLVENENIGKHLDGDIGHGVDALFDTAIKDSYGGVERYDFTISEANLGYQKLTSRDSKMSSIDEAYPHLLALHSFAPQLGWELKNYMKTVRKHFGSIAITIGAALWDKGIVTPTGKYVYNRRHPGILKTLKEGTEFIVDLYSKMAIRPTRVNAAPPNRFSIAHQTSSCRAGESAQNSVVNSDFESHDVDNLFVSSAAVIPRAPLSHSHVPTCVVAAYTWRRMVENHFSRGA